MPAPTSLLVETPRPEFFGPRNIWHNRLIGVKSSRFPGPAIKSSKKNRNTKKKHATIKKKNDPLNNSCEKHV